jgi:hypothetical protein
MEIPGCAGKEIHPDYLPGPAFGFILPSPDPMLPVQAVSRLFLFFVELTNKVLYARVLYQTYSQCPYL